MPAHPAQDTRNGNLHEEDNNKRSTSTIVPPLIEDLCISPSQIHCSSSSGQLTKPNPTSSEPSPAHKNKLIQNISGEEHSNNDSGIIINIEDSEAADFVYPRMYTSSLNVEIK